MSENLKINAQNLVCNGVNTSDIIADRDYWKREAIKNAAELGEAKIRQVKLGLTDENIADYKLFEDECVEKGFSFNSLLDARERRTPMKPRENNCCDICSSYLKNYTSVKSDYCPNCGQKIDWSV